MIFGGIAATAVSFYDIGPPLLRLPLMMLFAAFAGMAWIIVPLWLRVRWRVNEIIVTLLLNYVAFNFLLHNLIQSLVKNQRNSVFVQAAHNRIVVIGLNRITRNN